MKQRNRAATRTPEDFCPICGERVNWNFEHHCPKSVLGSIDAANTRALNYCDDPAATNFSEPDLSERLKYGFSLLAWNR